MNTQNKKTILLAEDELLIAMDEKALLEDNGYTVIAAHSGEDTVRLAAENSAISLVLMDIDLGDGMDGTEAARRILEIRDIPIVFLTSHAERDMVEKVRDITRYGYVIKNSGDFVLLSSIEMAFELFEAHRNMKENAERFRGVFETSPVGIAIVDTTDQRILQTNPSFRDLVGYSAEELTDMTVRDVTHPDDWEHEVEIIGTGNDVVTGSDPVKVKTIVTGNSIETIVLN